MSALGKIIDITARVAIIADRDNVGRTMAQTLTRLNFRNTQIFGSCEAFWNNADNNQFDWVMLALGTERFDDMLKFLDRRNQEPRYNSLAVSAFVPPRNTPLLPQCFEKGLLSSHAQELQAPSVEVTLTELMRVARDYDKREPYVAAHYLRQFLRQQRFTAELLNLEQTMASCFYEDSENYLRLAEAQFMTGQAERGRLTLAELQHFDASLSAKASSLYEEYVGSVHDHLSTFATQQNLRRAVIIDSDRSSANVISLALSKIGVRDVKIFADGLTAWNELSVGEEPDLIVSEWLVPVLSGPLLLQRLRDHGFFRVPVIVVSQHLERADQQLLKELTVSQVMRKPLQEKQTLMAIAWSVSQHRLPTEAKTIERKVIEALRENDMATANSLRLRFKNLTKVSQARKLYLDGAFAYHEGHYAKAVDDLSQSLHTREGDNVDVVGLLGRALLKLGDAPTAARMFEKASALSPRNIKRLCELADTQMLAGKLKDAKKTISQARSIDKKSPQVGIAATKFAVVTGDLDSVANLVRNLSSFQEIIGFINNMAIAKSRLKDFQEGLALYDNLLQILSPHDHELKAIVLYNQAICFIRAGQLLDADKALTTATAYGDSRVLEKANLLHIRLERAQRDGKTLKVAEQDEVTVTTAPADEEQLLAALETPSFWAKRQKGRTTAGLLGIYRVSSVLGTRGKKSDRQAS